MSIFGKLFTKADGKEKGPSLSEEELIERLQYCKEHDLPVHHRIHGDLKVTRVEEERFFADSDSRQNLMFPYKYFGDGLLTLPDVPEHGKNSGGAW